MKTQQTPDPDSLPEWTRPLPDPAPQDQDQRLADAVAGLVACTDPDAPVSRVTGHSPHYAEAAAYESTQHSILPWRNNGGQIERFDGFPNVIATVGKVNQQSWKDTANANYIVRACNEYEALKAHAHKSALALAAAERLADALRKANTCASLPDSVKQVIREALAQWEAGQ